MAIRRIGADKRKAVRALKQRNAEDLLKRADAAMYRSKYDGGNKVSFYEKAIQLAVDERLLLEKDLHSALENDELFLVYQPQYTLATGKICGVEALARWRNTEGEEDQSKRKVDLRTPTAHTRENGRSYVLGTSGYLKLI